MPDTDSGSRPSRRAVIGGLAGGAAAAWAAPAIVSVDAARAATVPPAPFVASRLAGVIASSWIAQDATGAVRTSNDGGVNWGPASGYLDFAIATAMAAGADVLLATDGTGLDYSSDQGATWLAATAPSGPITLFSQEPLVLVAGGVVYVAASIDTWFAATTSPSQPLTSLTGSGGRFAGFGTSSWFVSDGGGDSWAVPATPPPSIAPTALVGGEGSFVAVVGGAVWVSTDSGSTWHLPTGAVPAFTPTLVTGSDTIYVATDGAGLFAWSSDSGNTWAAPATPPGLNATLMAGYGPGPFVATDGDTWFRSDDGNVWGAVAVPPV